MKGGKRISILAKVQHARAESPWDPGGPCSFVDLPTFLRPLNLSGRLIRIDRVLGSPESIACLRTTRIQGCSTDEMRFLLATQIPIQRNVCVVDNRLNGQTEQGPSERATRPECEGQGRRLHVRFPFHWASQSTFGKRMISGRPNRSQPA